MFFKNIKSWRESNLKNFTYVRVKCIRFDISGSWAVLCRYLNVTSFIVYYFISFYLARSIVMLRCSKTNTHAERNSNLPLLSFNSKLSLLSQMNVPHYSCGLGSWLLSFIILKEIQNYSNKIFRLLSHVLFLKIVIYRNAIPLVRPSPTLRCSLYFKHTSCQPRDNSWLSIYW